MGLTVGAVAATAMVVAFLLKPEDDRRPVSAIVFSTAAVVQVARLIRHLRR